MTEGTNSGLKQNSPAGVLSQVKEGVWSVRLPSEKGVFFVSAIQDDERLSAEEMDERRRQNIAYEYLCHLEEAKQ